ncbi:MAG: GNAT family N-acetyltransferase [Clostridia bacterium]|nr:GNAT family N-acetyltransferase [Clostridia bacterium]
MIREMQLSEIDECVNVIKTAFLTVAEDHGFTAENAPRFTAFAMNRARLQWQFSHEHRPMFVYLIDDKIVGYYSLSAPNEGETELNNLSVLPEFRHNGIGEAMLKHAFAFAKAQACSAIHIGIVEENQTLRRWYEKFGFTHTGTQKFDFFPFTCGYMKKTLA